MPLRLCLRLIRHYHLQVANRLETTSQVARVQALKLGALTRREVRRDSAFPAVAQVAAPVAAQVAARAGAQAEALVATPEVVVSQVGLEDPQPARQAGAAQAAVVVHQAGIRPVVAIRVSTQIGGHKAIGFQLGDQAGDQAATPTQIRREAVVEALLGLEVAAPTVLVVIPCMIC